MTARSQPDAQHKFSAQSGKRLGEDFVCFYCSVFSNASTLVGHKLQLKSTQIGRQA